MPGGLDDPSRDVPRTRIARLVATVAAVVPVACAAVALGLAWRYSELILRPGAPPSLREQRVLDAAPDRVRLSRDHESLQPGTWALEWPGGYGWVDAVLATGDTHVVRAFRAVRGLPPRGGWASLRGVPRAADPRALLGLSFTEVRVPGPLGPLPAWWVPGPDTTWVLYVHGRGTGPAEGLRTLDVMSARGLPGLLLTYRGDAGAPPPADGLSRLGLDEWRDLDAAARYALGRGARRLVLCGYSMGGQLVVRFLARSPLAHRVAGVVLESPLLDWSATLRARARVLGVPPLLARLGMGIAAARAGIDWDSLDLVRGAPAGGPDVLLLHGAHDTFVPLASSEAFARARAGRVTLVRVPTGDHVEAWNADPARYRATLERWLSDRRIGHDAQRPPDASAPRPAPAPAPRWSDPEVP